MKALLACLALLLSVSALAMPPRPPSPEMRAAHLARELELSEQQYADLLVLLQHQAESARAMHCRDQDARLQRRNQNDSEIEALLSDAQRERFAELRLRRPEPPAGRGPCGPAAADASMGGAR